MTRLAERLVRLVCAPDWHEEILGDLEELGMRRGDRATGARRVRELWQVASICVRGHRRRRQSAALITASTFLVAALTLGLRRTTHITIAATDDAGAFTLEFAGRRVVAATVNGAPLHNAHIAQRHNVVLLRGADHGNDLVIRIPREGAIEWTPRRPY